MVSEGGGFFLTEIHGAEKVTVPDKFTGLTEGRKGRDGNDNPCTTSFQGNGTAWKVEIYRYRMQPGQDIVVDSEAVSILFWRRMGSGDSEQ